MTERKEQWRPVVGFEGLYEVSDVGSVRRVGGRTLTPHPNRQGYRRVALSNRTIKRVAFVHKLVLEAFVSLKPDGCETRHLNGNRADNRVENLAWGTAAQNAEDRRRHGTDKHGDDNPFAKLTSDVVKEIRASSESSRKLAKRLLVDPTTIQKVRRGETWRSVEAA